MARRGRASRARASFLARAAALERELAELARDLTEIEDFAQGRVDKYLHDTFTLDERSG